VACTTNAQCSGGETCYQDACTPADCTSTSCGHGLVCNPVTLVCVHCQVNDDCNSASEICVAGQCDTKQPTGTLGCAQVVLCEEGCFDFDCPNYCDAAATYFGAELYNALNECLAVNCPDSDPDCWNASEAPGGACYSQTVACEQDP
jgi:hypothetical protein